jgi:hypothetical protein
LKERRERKKRRGGEIDEHDGIDTESKTFE